MNKAAAEREVVVQSGDGQCWIQSDGLCFFEVPGGLTQEGAAAPRHRAQLLQSEALREQRAGASEDYGQPPPQSQS